MTERDRAMEVAKNLSSTIKSIKGTTVIGNSAIKGNIFTSPKADKNVLIKQLERLCKKHGINIEDI